MQKRWRRRQPSPLTIKLFQIYNQSHLATALLTVPYVVLTWTNGCFYITGRMTANFVSKRWSLPMNYHPLGEESSHASLNAVKWCKFCFNWFTGSVAHQTCIAVLGSTSSKTVSDSTFLRAWPSNILLKSQQGTHNIVGELQILHK